MTLSMKEEETFDPSDMSVFGANAVVEHTRLRADLIEQFWRGLRHDVSRQPTERKFVKFTGLQHPRI
jgi:hypothetical protein